VAHADLEVIRYADRFGILAHAVAIAPAGLCLEFGVAGGRSLNFIAALAPERRIYGFDCFYGNPEPWGGYPAGHFACEPPIVPANAELVVGYFADTLEPFLIEHPGDAALIHVDCDLYSSTVTVLKALRARIVPGTVIVFDEYWISEERRAFDEFLFSNRRSCRHICRGDEQLCVVME
jgi:hypothetical protein